MTDNQLIQLFLPIINAGLTAYGYTGIIVKQSNQPTQQGIPTAPTVYFFKVGDKRYGYPHRYDVWNGTNEVHTESQIYETTFQISALVLQNPLTPNSFTASDLVNDVAAIMQSDATINTFAASNVGILRVMEVPNPYFVDDHDNFEAAPSFTFVLTYSKARAIATNVIESVDYAIYPI